MFSMLQYPALKYTNACLSKLLLLLLQGVVREVLGLQLNTGQAAQACVTFTQLNSNGGTQAAQVWHGKWQWLS